MRLSTADARSSKPYIALGLKGPLSPYLTVLELSECKVPDWLFIQLGRQNVQLKKLSLIAITADKQLKPCHEPLTGLTHLTIKGTRFCRHNLNLGNAYSECRSLQFFDIKRGVIPRAEEQNWCNQVKNIALASSNTLETLKVDTITSDFSKQMAKILQMCVNVKELELAGGHFFTNFEEYKNLQNCKSLHSLTINEQCIELTEQRAMELFNSKIFPCLKKLKCRLIEDKNLVKHFSGCPNIESVTVNLSTSYSEYNDLVRHFKNNCKNFKNLFCKINLE